MNTLETLAIIIAIAIIFINNKIVVTVVFMENGELDLGCFLSLQFPDTQAVTCVNSHYSGNMHGGYTSGTF